MRGVAPRFAARADGSAGKPAIAAHLPGMTTDTVLDRIDDQARHLAQSALSGELAEREARVGLCALLLESDVPAVVASSRWRSALSWQQRSDLAENILTHLVSQVLGHQGSTFDLARIADGSLCGWARMLGAEVARWDPSVRPRRLDAVTVQVSPLAPVNDSHLVAGSASSATVHGRSEAAETSYHAAQAFGGLSAEEMALSRWADTEWAMEALERAVNEVGFAREPERAGAAVLREVLGLPRLCVPADGADRAMVLNRVQTDQLLARRSLVQMASMVCTEPPHLPVPGEAPVGELMLSLWDDFEPAHLESLMIRPAKAAHIIVVDGLALGPKPPRAVVRALTRDVLAVSGEKDWPITVDGLVPSFLATCTEAVSAFDDTNDTAAKETKRVLASTSAARWPALAARAAAFRSAPLGSTAEQVRERIRTTFETERRKESTSRIAARTRRGLGRDPEQSGEGAQAA